MARFTGVPELPPDLSEWEFRVLTALKQNVELLTGARNEIDGASRALVRSDISVSSLINSQFTGLSAKGGGVAIAGVSVPTLEDYTALLQDFIRLGQDVAVLRNTVSVLIKQLKGS